MLSFTAPMTDIWGLYTAAFSPIFPSCLWVVFNEFHAGLSRI